MPAPIGRVTPPASTSSLTTAARGWAEAFNFNSPTAVRRLEVARALAPTTGPASLQRAYALYRSWEDNDLGSARMLKTTVAGQELFALHTTTDGDDGFVELFNDKGALLASGTTGFGTNGQRQIRWDAAPGAVREQVAPKNSSPSVEAFLSAVDVGKSTSSASGATLTAAELRAAAKNLVGAELTTASVDGFENAALFRVLADSSSKLTSGSRAYAEQLSALYTDAGSTALSRLSQKPLGTTSPFTRGAQVASATVGASGALPRMNTMIELSRRTWNMLPSQVVPVTRTEAQKALREAGASAAEAKAAVDSLADAKGQVYLGRFFENDSSWMPKPKGLALFGVPANGRALTAINVPTTPAPQTGAVARDVIKGLLGVDREVEVVARRQTATGEELDLRWRPTGTGGLIGAKLSVPLDGSDATIDGLTMPPPHEERLAESLAERLMTGLGVPQKVLGWVGRDGSLGVGFVVAHQPASGGPATLSMVRIQVGGASATVTPKAMGTTASDTQLAKDLAINLVRAHAAAMVADPSMPDAARLEVALRTRFAQASELEVVSPADSPVGFDPAKDRLQLMLGNVWGDNAVFVTFAKSGAVRVEDFN